MVKHVLADGRSLEDITGYVIPNAGNTKAAYSIAADIVNGCSGPKERRADGCQVKNTP